MVAAAWKTGVTKPVGMTIYNCCTGEVRPITWGRLVSLAIEKMRIHPLGKQHFSYQMTNNIKLHFQREHFGIRLGYFDEIG